MQNILMSSVSDGYKLDPLTTILFMAPNCFLASLLVNYYLVDATSAQAIIMTHAFTHWPQLLLSCAIAFIVNVIIAIQICLFNAVGFILAGVMKDITIIAVSAFY